jgi:hypothetical protein|tara:strand:- start:317 stop:541 length:225 start_codon:yes stop_codon:yes gene_type:complete
MEMNYIIYKTKNISEINFSEVEEDNSNTLRLSIDGTQTILKFRGAIPAFLSGNIVYNHQQILDIINNPVNGWIK